MTDAFLVVDMQQGLLEGGPTHDLAGVVERINRVAAHVRAAGGRVVWIQHAGPEGTEFAPGRPGWQFLPELDQQDADLVVGKRLNDAFAGTDLSAVLEKLAPDRLLVAGWATDFCVDSTVRSAVSHRHAVTVVADGHTLADRPHLSAPDVIRHHNWVWSALIATRPLRVADASAILEDR